MIDIKLKELIDKGNKILDYRRKSVEALSKQGIADLTGNVDNMKFTEWKYSVEDYMLFSYGDKNIYLERFKENVKKPNVSNLKNGLGILNYMESNSDTIKNLKLKKESNFNSNDILETIMINLEKMVTQLSTRDRKKEPLIMNDEYDIQYLLSSVLKLFFADVRVEESMPSSVKSSNRIDIFLPEIESAIETKFLRDEKSKKTLIAQIKEDIVSYQQHPKIKKLYFYIYDQNKKIKNPKSYENDLNGNHNEINVKIIINR